MKIVAHRGLRSELPENTLDAITAAIDIDGIHGVEFDVELTADGGAVVIHQETVIPNPSFAAIIPASRDFTSRDWTSQRSTHEIEQLDAGSWFGSGFTSIKVPTLKKVLELNWKNKTAFVELKDATFWGTRDTSRPARVVDATIAELCAFQGQLEIISFNPRILEEVHFRAPHLPRILAVWTDRQQDVSGVLEDARRCKASTILFADKMVIEKPEWIVQSRESGFSLFVYPISPAWDEPEHSDWTASSQISKWNLLESLAIDGIISDFARESVNHHVAYHRSRQS